LGGEPSAHFLFLKEHFCVDDALFAAYKFLRLLGTLSGSLDEWLQDLPTVYSTPIQKIFFSSREKVLDTGVLLAQKFSNMGYPVSKTDGIRVLFSDFSWILIRASNTENCLSLRIEADTVEGFAEIKKFFAREIGSMLGLGQPKSDLLFC
jgi:phosphomannomutase